MPANALGPRATMTLDGLWDFEFEGQMARLGGEGHTIRAPGIWQTQFPALRNAQGTGRYRRWVRLPPGWAGKRIVLVMEGVFHESLILVDEAAVAVHGDGWTAIGVDLTDAVDGKTSFMLGVDARVPDDRTGGRFSQSLVGKQDWYGVQGGIWKSARLEARDPFHFRELAVRCAYDLERGTVTAKAILSRAAPATVRLRLSSADGAVAVSEVAASSPEVEAGLEVLRPQAWSPGAPALYRLETELLAGGRLVDADVRIVGFRRFEARKGRLFLNGEPFFLIGALDQDWRPEEESRAPDPNFLEERFVRAKAMGLNALRCHVKIPDRLYFDLADRLGLVVWLDMPYMEHLSPASRTQRREVFRRSVLAHGWRPSISIWTLFNEGWGIELDDNPDDRRWLLDTFDWAKALVPESLLIDNSPCFPRNYHLKTEIEDFHWYSGFPHQNERFAAIAAAFAKRAPWAWSPHGDAARRGGEPLVCSEFGVWGLPNPRQILDRDGREPWWFESGHDWNGGAAYPHGIETRFRDAQLKPVFGDLDGFVNAAQELQFRALKYQIETLRWERAISGYVVTELNDTQWEANGLMDVMNRPRAFAEKLETLQKRWLVIARAPRTAIRCGESFNLPVRLAGAEAPPAGARFRWRFGDEAGEAGLGEDSTTIALTAGNPGRIALAPLELEARDGSGRLLSRNSVEFCVVPDLGETAAGLFPIDAEAEAMLSALGWPRRVARAEAAASLVATRLTTPLREALISGKKAIVIANSADALVDPERDLPLSDRHNFPQMLIKAREGTPWDGQWMGAFAWRRTDGRWAPLPNGPMLDEHWVGLCPNYVLTGFPSTAFGGLVDAGVAVGWLHHAAAFAKRSFLGRAWLTVTTFDLTSKKAAENPLAPHLLAALAAS